MNLHTVYDRLSWEVGRMWRTSIPLATHQFSRSPHIFCAFCPVLSLLLLWTVLLGPHQDLWLCDLLSDGWHKQPLNKVVKALAPNIHVQFLSLLHQEPPPLRSEVARAIRQTANHKATSPDGARVLWPLGYMGRFVITSKLTNFLVHHSFPASTSTRQRTATELLKVTSWHTLLLRLYLPQW